MSDLISSFIRYSYHNGKKICLFIMTDKGIKRKNIVVTALPQNGILECIPSGKKSPVSLSLDEILTAGYSKGDTGDIEG